MFNELRNKLILCRSLYVCICAYTTAMHRTDEYVYVKQLRPRLRHTLNDDDQDDKNGLKYTLMNVKKHKIERAPSNGL